jgi:DNA-binding transcriptional ArsR family regulator
MADALSTTFAALSDPTRRSILAHLAGGEATVTELAEPYAMSLPAVSRHLKVLENAGLVVKSRDAQWRPCRLEPAPLRRVDEWMATYRTFFEERFDRLEEQLAAMVGDERLGAPPVAEDAEAVVEPPRAAEQRTHRRPFRRRKPLNEEERS